MARTALPSAGSAYHPALAPAALVVTGALLGLNMNVAKQAIVLGLAPAAFLFWSVLGSGLVLLVLSVVLRQAPRLTGPNLRYGLISGFATIALSNTLLFLAIPHVGAGFVSLVGAFPPLYTYLFALSLRMEPPHWLRAAGVALGIAGAIILGFSKASVGGADVVWVVISLGVPVIIAVGNIYRTRYWPAGTGALQLAPLMLLGAALSILLYVLVAEPATLGSSFALGLATLILPGQVALFSLMYVMYFVLQKVAGPVYFSQIGSVGAVLGATVAVFWFGEVMPAAIVPAGLCIAGGVACVTIGQRMVMRRLQARPAK